MFDDKLSIKTFEQFSIDMMDALAKTPEEDKLIIFFSTPGGSVLASYAFFELLKKYKDYIEIVIGHQMTSAGAIMLHLLDGFNVYTTDLDLEVMFHCVRADINTSYPDRAKYEADLKSYNKRFYTILKKRGLEESKLKEFQEGKDVYLSIKDMLQVFPYIKVKKYL